MTIDERLEELLLVLPLRPANGEASRTCTQRIRSALLEVARDQRHACVEAINQIDRNAWSGDAVRQAVMNAEIK